MVGGGGGGASLATMVGARLTPATPRCRQLRASEPGERLFLSVGVLHPQLGPYFSAVLDARVSKQPHLPNETASLR